MRRQELLRFIEEAGTALQQIQDEFGRKNVPEARVRFPRGFIRRAVGLRRTLPNIGTDIQRSNAASSLMALDVFRWLVIRTDLSGAALSMIVKESISVIGALCDWLMKEATNGHGSRRSYMHRSQKLVDLGQISTNLKAELDWVWQIRCNVHMHEVSSLEYDMYSRDDYNRAVRAYHQLRDVMVIKHG